MIGTTELTKRIHRPLTNLEKGLDGYLHGASALYMFAKTRKEPEIPLWAQRNMSSLYRASLARKGLEHEEAISDPRGVPESRRSPEWRELCALVDGWAGLPNWQRACLARALMIMSYHQLALDLTESVLPSLDPSDEWDAQLMLANAQCRVVLHFESSGRRTAYDPKPLSDLVARAPKASFARFKALNHLIMLYAQLVQDEKAASNHSEAMKDCARALGERYKDSAIEHLLMSNLYRVTSMVPFMRADRAAVAAEMAEAEAHAAAAVAAAPDEFLATENLYSLCETRTREAIWIGDFDRAEAAARRLIRLTPLDSKAWIELGEALYKGGKLEEAARAYITATWLGPPGLDIAYLMAGQCYGALGEHDLAKHYLMASFAHDDEESAALDALSEISATTGDDLVASWIGEVQAKVEARI
jgi:tetratricopeptide (TPR) repeat protein